MEPSGRNALLESRVTGLRSASTPFDGTHRKFIAGATCLAQNLAVGGPTSADMRVSNRAFQCTELGDGATRRVLLGWRCLVAVQLSRHTCELLEGGR
jgi:hypothetical protein